VQRSRSLPPGGTTLPGPPSRVQTGGQGEGRVRAWNVGEPRSRCPSCEASPGPRTGRRRPSARSAAAAARTARRIGVA
jgi:hypothetical protein